MSSNLTAKNLTKKVLFISNGTGEDLNASEVLKALKLLAPQLEVAALPVVGEGQAYQRLAVPIISPTQSLPSRGFVYMSNWQLFRDLQAGLINLTIGQLRSLLSQKQNFDFVFATGDIVVLAMAWLTGLPYAAFLVSASAHYENRFELPWLTQFLLRSPRCHRIFSRDAFTAELCLAQGLDRAIFAGYPIMDLLQPQGIDLGRSPEIAMIALLPGSRLPEACQNLGLLLELALLTAQEFAPHSVQFYAAIVPSMKSELGAIAQASGWQLQESHKLVKGEVSVICLDHAFADILNQCDLVVGMAGTAVEQAVGLGKPVIQIPGRGPQFTYRFAEAQMRLLGSSVQTIGTGAANYGILQAAAVKIKQVMGDRAYRQSCLANGRERVGAAGGSQQIAACLIENLISLLAEVA